MRMRELLSLRKKVEKKIEEVENVTLKQLEDELEGINNLIRAQCKHPKEAIVKEESYCGGGYYDREYWVTWPKCTICGATGEKKTTYGSYG